MSKESINIEVLADLFENAGVKATEGQIALIAKDFASHLSMERDIDVYAHMDNSESKEDLKRKIRTLEDKVRSLERENGAFVRSVKQRRNCEEVWIENGTVMYR